ncbi:uncharacterized protein LOC127799787 [Diospyros lotus]|uniref:uncharacterized protein LOC127799787 n=1 Tax=Diospyros lotus TaxID=55363 RepID=UPI00225AABA3|nr:uncharacterized protein LOC127799787 [Diospyros lotus]
MHLAKQRGSVSPCRNRYEDVHGGSRRLENPRLGVSLVGISSSHADHRYSPDCENRGRPPPLDHRPSKQGTAREKQPPIGRSANQDPIARELLLRIQQLEVRHGAHSRRESHKERTQFSREIELEPFPRRFKVPSISQYNGDSDPYDHLNAFNVQMDLQTSNSLAKCRAFSATLGDIPRAWLRRLHPRSICSWEGCQNKFIDQYRSLRRQLAPTSHLAMVFLRSSESLKDYIERFRCEVNNVESPSDESILTAMSAGLRKDGKLYESIYKSPVRDLGEFYERAAKEERIFTTERNKEDFGRLNPLKTPDKFRSKSKLCAYHNEAGHTTSECWALKDAIEELIRRVRLRNYVVCPRDKQSKQPAQPSPHQALEPEPPTVRTIFTIHGGPHIVGTSNRSHEQHVREVGHLLFVGDGTQERPSKKAKMASDDISFTKNDSKDVHWPHNDALVVRARIGNMEVRRVMVDTGSLVNVMYRGCFD